MRPDLTTFQLQACCHPRSHRRQAPPQRAQRNPRTHSLHPERDGHLQDTPVWRPCEPRWPRRRSAQATTEFAYAARLAVFVCLSKVLVWDNGLGAAERDQDGYGCQRVYTGLSLAMSRRRHWESACELDLVPVGSGRWNGVVRCGCTRLSI
jgi:hypothetical protein